MIIGQRVRIVCETCEAETHGNLVLMVTGQMGPQVPKGWQVVAPHGPDGAPMMGPLACFCELHHRDVRPRLVEPVTPQIEIH